jgi:hypothetical protein
MRSSRGPSPSSPHKFAASARSVQWRGHARPISRLNARLAVKMWFS